MILNRFRRIATASGLSAQFSLLMGLLAALAIGAGIAVVVTFAKLADVSDRITAEDVPTLIAATELRQLAAAYPAALVALAAAEGGEGRTAAINRTQALIINTEEQLNGIVSMPAMAVAPSPLWDAVQRVREVGGRLAVQAAALDRLVRERFGHMQALAEAREHLLSLRLEADAMVASERGELDAQGGEQSQIVRRRMTLLLNALAIARDGSSETAEVGFFEAQEVIAGLYWEAASSEPVTPRLAELERRVWPALRHEQGALALRLRYLSHEEAIRSQLAMSTETAIQLATDVGGLVAVIEAGIQEKRAGLDRRTDIFIAVIVGASVLVMVAFLGAFVYVRQEVIGRLLALRDGISAFRGGGDAPDHALFGHDEVGQIAQALSDLAQAVVVREQSLRAERDKAAAALKDLKETQERLIESEKMASLAQLIAGIAHEINTPVGIIIGAVSQLEQETATIGDRFASGGLTRSDLADYIGVTADLARLIRSRSEHAGELIRSFKAVSVDQASGDRRRFALKEYIEEVVVSLSGRIRKSGHEVRVTGPAGVSIDSYPGALSQVVTNLVLNALIHAWPEGGERGRLEIDIVAPETGPVMIMVGDDGVGIAPEHQRKVFEPFFTTKRGSGGSGLGLHIVYNLITYVLGGSIVLNSEPGIGTTFTFTLPPVAPEGRRGVEGRSAQDRGVTDGAGMERAA